MICQKMKEVPELITNLVKRDLVQLGIGYPF